MGIVGFLGASAAVEAAAVSLKAIKKNGVAVPVGQQSNLPVLGNDTIEAEIFLSGWASDFPVDDIPNHVRIFQLQINSAGLVSPDNGTALPLGWCAPLSKIECTNPAMCPAAYPLCSPAAGCTCAGHNPDLGAFITTSRPDFLLNGLDANFDTRTDVLNYLYYGLAIDNVGVPDTGVARYLGTLILKIAANACGTFTINFVNEPLTTFIGDPASTPNLVLPTLQPLVLTVSECCRLLWSCLPGHCNIDARIAHAPNDPSVRLTTNTIVMAFCESTADMTLEDFEVTIVPDGGIVPTRATVTPSLGNRVTIILNRRIAPEEWTCVRHIDSNRRCCIGSLPGDVDGNRIVESADGFELFDNLNGGVNPMLAIEKCDIDRSLLCTPADMLMFVDLLNDPFFCDFEDCPSLPVCPLMFPPP